jgi:hypothetical protein
MSVIKKSDYCADYTGLNQCQICHLLMKIKGARLVRCTLINRSICSPIVLNTQQNLFEGGDDKLNMQRVG